jgi:peptidyl-prolyl cis-trans isomerase C
MPTDTANAPALAIPAPHAPARNGNALWLRIKREPLLQFVALGALIFVAAHVVQSHRATVERQIVVDDQLEKRLVQLVQTQSGLTPRGEQLDELIQNYIDDEVMYREGLRMGLDQDDEIVRRRLIQKVQFLQRDLAGIPTPSESDLHAYYESHPQFFSAPASVAFEQLYFSADRDGWDAAEARARNARQRLASTTPASSDMSDDPFPIQIPAEELTRAAADSVFGDTPVADALFASHEGAWSEPLRSAYGWHLIKVVHRRTTTLAPFGQVRGQVVAAWTQDRAEAAEQKALRTLRARYDIVRSTGHEAD